jgi:endonuclease I
MRAPGAGASGEFSLSAQGGIATWTIPLTVSVGVGGYGATAPTLAWDPGRSPEVPGAELRRQLEIYVAEVTSQKSVLRGLSFLQTSREGPYLPSDAEIEQRRAAYYGELPAEVAADNVSPAELYDALHSIQSARIRIASSFPESLGGLESLRPAGLESTLRLESDTLYARSRAHLYTWADLQEHRMLACVYTGTLISPEQLLLKDLLVQLGMEDALPQRFRNNQFLNCEHIVPQSWFDEESVPRADMHHLITADGQANNFRSDSVYRELGNAGELGPADRPAYLPEAGRKAEGPKRFEPSRGKEVVARATLYFLLTHKEKIDDSKYDAAAIETLRAWARATPPSAYERHRNEAIFEVQDNRNPLIDFPAWVDRIDFSRGMAH